MINSKEDAINIIIKGGLDTNKISDGYHTFEELYEHRIALFIALCRLYNVHFNAFRPIWVSKKHSDGSELDGWFVMGINKGLSNQIRYHLPMSKWDICAKFAEELDQAPKFDSCSPNDVLERLAKLFGV